MFELLLITDPSAPLGIVASVVRALALQPPRLAARVAVQLRAKSYSDAELAPIAHALRAVTRDAGTLLLINARLELARQVAADGVQLPEAGVPLSRARAALGPSAWIGASCHDPAGLLRAAEGGANYATLSPVFATPGKGPALGCARFAEWTRAATLPVFALGGVHAQHAAALRRAGAQGLAVISAVSQAADPAVAVRDLLRAFRAAGDLASS